MIRLLLTISACVALFACTGNLPTSGKLPSVDGAAITNVDAASVGGAKVDSAATASTLVKRDATGNFTANVITATLNGGAAFSNFAWGAKGGNLTSSVLNPGSDGNYFAVTVTQVDGIVPMNAGVRITLEMQPATGTTVLFKNSALLKMAGGGDFTASTGDILEFVSTERGIWRELSRVTTSDSRVFLYLSAGFSVPSSTAEFQYPVTVGGDAQGEYVAADGKIHFKQGGFYHVDASVRIEPTGNWTTTVIGTSCALVVYVGDGTVPNGRNRFTDVTGVEGGKSVPCVAHTSFELYAAPGHEMFMTVSTNETGTSTVVGSGSFPTTPASNQMRTFLSMRRVR